MIPVDRIIFDNILQLKNIIKELYYASACKYLNYDCLINKIIN